MYVAVPMSMSAEPVGRARCGIKEPYGAAPDRDAHCSLKHIESHHGLSYINKRPRSSVPPDSGGISVRLRRPSIWIGSAEQQKM